MTGFGRPWFGPGQLAQDDFPPPYSTAGNDSNIQHDPSFDTYTTNLRGAQQDLRDRSRSSFLAYGVPPGPQMSFQPDAQLDPSQANFYRDSSQPPLEATMLSWQHILRSLRNMAR